VQYFKPGVIVALIVLSTCGYAQEYWQQEVNYVISVKLDDENHELIATAEIEYVNNSPDDLNEIYMHLWPNAYKNRKTALCRQLVENEDTELYYASAEDRGFIDSLDFTVDGQKVQWALDEDYIDICKIDLNEPLKSGARITIKTPFHVKIPTGIFSRLGHIGESYQITQWYPKPAVYDMKGWHAMPYLDQGEFYSEFGSYDVSITLPQNYVVGATGDMVEGEEEKKWLEQRIEETKEFLADPLKLLKAVSPQEVKLEHVTFPKSSTTKKTLRFKQSRVHDFAWFADKRWHVLKGEVELPHSKDVVETWVMFTNAEADLWKNGIEYMNDAIYYYSLWNGDYPYRHATAVDGALSAGGGMEYPNVTVIGTSGSAFDLETVIMHEIGHNWFYGILGSNERDHPWMDEGLNSFNENRYIETKYPNKKLIGSWATTGLGRFFDLDGYKHKEQYYYGYLLNARRNLDQPIEYKSETYTMVNYGAVVYGKTAVVFDYLMAYLGKKTMDSAMHTYYDRWKFKHPQPGDLKEVMEEVAGKNLDWFFDDMINTTKKLDYKIIAQKSDENGNLVMVKNVGEITGPVSISAMRDGKVAADIWYDGFDGTRVFEYLPGEYDAFKIDGFHDMPEIQRKNNTIRTRGIFKKTEPLRLQFLMSLDNPDKSQVFYTPLMGWNDYDHFMFGALFHNYKFPKRKFEWYLMPMYSSSTEQLLGSVNMDLTLNPRGNVFQHINITLAGKRYSNGEQYSYISGGNSKYAMVQYNRIKPAISFKFKNPRARSKVENLLTFSHHQLTFTNKPIDKNFEGTSGSLSVTSFPSEDYYINKLRWSHYNNKTIHPYGIAIDFEQGKHFIKANLEIDFELSYKWENKGLDIQFFAGRFIFNDYPNVNSRFAYSLDGNTDYLYDHVILGRQETEGVLGAQLVSNDGGFRNFVNMGPAQTWLTSINLQTALWKGVPLAFYVDVGWTSYDPTQTIYGMGATIVVVKNLFEVYLPFYTSTGAIHSAYERNIRFMLNLTEINPFKLLNNIPH